MTVERLHDLLEANARRAGAVAAVGGDRGPISARELLTAVDRRATELRDEGLRSDDRVALVVSEPVRATVDLFALEVLGVSTLLVDQHSTEWERRRFTSLFVPRVTLDGQQVHVHHRDDQRGADAEPFVALATSGTGAAPRLVARPWSTVLACGAQMVEALTYDGGDRIVCCTPLSHNYAFTVGLVAGISGGATVELPRLPVSPARLEMSLHNGASMVLAVPFQYRWFVDSVQQLGRRPRCAISAGESMDAATWDRALSLGLPMADHYGGTEAGSITLGDIGERIGVGRPLRGTAVRTNDEGVVEVRPVGTPPWCVGDPEATHRTVVGSGWVQTGDLGSLDVDGYLWLSGRRSDFVKIASRRVNLREVEQALQTVAGVTDAAAVAVPAHSGPGDEVRAYVEGEIDVAHLRRQLAGLLSSYKLPRKIVVVDELPRTRSGKVRRGLLHQ